MTKEFELSVFVGRFQPYHKGHHAVITEALEKSHYVTPLIGSSNAVRSFHNPFTFEERKAMIMMSLPPEVRHRVICKPTEDWISDTYWVTQSQAAVNEAIREFPSFGGAPKNKKIALIGHKKDNSSYYLDMFPQWDSIDVENYLGLNATDIRQSYFSNIEDMWLTRNRLKEGDDPNDYKDHVVSEPVWNFLNDFGKTAEYQTIKQEYEFSRKMKMCRVRGPDPDDVGYPAIYVTVDAVVFYAGHVLLVKRKNFPGKGLWALPGGFLDENEYIEDAVFRELSEETKLAVPLPVLRRSVFAQKCIDDPKRSSRGRTITHAFGISLEGKFPKVGGKDVSLPEIEAADDAAKAAWVPLASLRRDKMFEDHFSIIRFFENILDKRL